MDLEPKWLQCLRCPRESIYLLLASCSCHLLVWCNGYVALWTLDSESSDRGSHPRGTSCSLARSCPRSWPPDAHGAWAIRVSCGTVRPDLLGIALPRNIWLEPKCVSSGQLYKLLEPKPGTGQTFPSSLGDEDRKTGWSDRARGQTRPGLFTRTPQRRRRGGLTGPVVRPWSGLFSLGMARMTTDIKHQHFCKHLLKQIHIGTRCPQEYG